jgi:flagellar basal-body rod modification protein FlgD
MAIYPPTTLPPRSTLPHEPWTKDNIPVTDGSERQMGKDAFLTLLLVQLQNQDPTNPMENTEMVAQLAQFSQLEQLANLSKGIDTMTGFIQAQNQFQTLTMIGKDVVAANNQLSVTGGQQDVNAAIVTTETCRATVYVVNSRGERVRTIEMGTIGVGEHAFTWDGRYEDGSQAEDGVYGFQILAHRLSGEVIEDGIYPQVSGKITAVSFDAAGQPVVHMGHAFLSLGQVMRILEGGRLAQTGTGSGSDS